MYKIRFFDTYIRIVDTEDSFIVIEHNWNKWRIIVLFLISDKIPIPSYSNKQEHLTFHQNTKHFKMSFND